MKNNLIVFLLFAFGTVFFLPNTSAQKAAGQANPSGKVKPATEVLPAIPCDGCTHGIPAVVYSSTKNAATVYGPPDSKGAAVEYQVFTQSKSDRSWKLEAAGQVSDPGDKATFKYYQPAQIVVFIYCKTPFAEMVTFSNIRVAAPTKTGELPCTNCTCDRCENKAPTALFSSDVNGVTVTRLCESSTCNVEYQVFTQDKNKSWKNEKAAVLKMKGEKVTSCHSKPAQVLVAVYGAASKDVAVKFAPAPCNK